MKEAKTAREVAAYIEENLAGEMNLDEIACRFGYSKFHLNRLFSEAVGCTIYKYIQIRRLTEAARALAHTRRSVADIAFGAGYQSQQAFHHAFRQIYLSSPQAYRAAGIFVPRQLPFTDGSLMAVLKCRAA